jgi:pimeloyl-ACP methyl ester carboxylesterase
MITRGYASTVGGQIHYWECGAGPALVLLAPSPRSARVYRELLPLLGVFRALALDTRGFGESDPPGPHPTMGDYAEDVIRVLDSLGIARAHLFGLHTGNKIAAAAAAGWPERIDRVVLAGRTHSIVADKAARTAAIQASMTGTSTGPAVAGVPADLLERWAGQASDLDEPTVRALADEVGDAIAGWAGVGPIYAANYEFDLEDAVAHVTAPTLIIELITAETAALGRQAPLLKAVMSSCEILEIQEHERTLLRDHPGRLADPLLAFLSA